MTLFRWAAVCLLLPVAAASSREPRFDFKSAWAALGEERRAATFTAGQAMTLEEGVHEAMREPPTAFGDSVHRRMEAGYAGMYPGEFPVTRCHCSK